MASRWSQSGPYGQKELQTGWPPPSGFNRITPGAGTTATIKRHTNCRAEGIVLLTTPFRLATAEIRRLRDR